MFCLHCGSENPNDATFCTSCGKNIQSEIVSVAKNEHDKPILEQSPLKLIEDNIGEKPPLDNKIKVFIFLCVLAVVGNLALPGADSAVNSSDVTAKANHTEKSSTANINGENELKLAAFKLTQFYGASVTPCDKYYGFNLIDPKYGVITHDIDERRRIFKLNSPVKAIMTGVEFTCQNNKRGTKNKKWTYLIIAKDTEFNVSRCQEVGSATEYEPDGNTPLRYNPDKIIVSSSSRLNAINKAQKCGFKSNSERHEPKKI